MDLSHQILSPYKLSGVGAYRIQTLYRRGVRVRVGLGFSIDETIGGQLAAGDHSRHYRSTLHSVRVCFAYVSSL